MSKATHVKPITTDDHWQKNIAIGQAQKKAEKNYYARHWLHCGYDQFVKYMYEWYDEVPFVNGNEQSYEAYKLRRRIENN